MDNKYKAGWYCQIVRLIPEMVYKYIGSINEPDDSLNVVLILKIGCNCKDTYPYLVHVLPFLPPSLPIAHDDARSPLPI